MESEPYELQPLGTFGTAPPPPGPHQPLQLDSQHPRVGNLDPVQQQQQSSGGSFLSMVPATFQGQQLKVEANGIHRTPPQQQQLVNNNLDGHDTTPSFIPDNRTMAGSHTIEGYDSSLPPHSNPLPPPAYILNKPDVMNNGGSGAGGGTSTSALVSSSESLSSGTTGSNPDLSGSRFDTPKHSLVAAAAASAKSRRKQDRVSLTPLFVSRGTIRANFAYFCGGLVSRNIFCQTQKIQREDPDHPSSSWHLR